MSWRVAGLFAFWTAVTGAIAFASACYTHNCDGDVITYGTDAGEGRLLGANTWESSPVDGPWLPFPRQRFYVFDLHELGQRAPLVPLPYVSAQHDPLHEGGNFTLGSGNITEISAADKGKIVIHNGTCADYYLRLVVEAEPLPPEPSDAGAADAQADAQPDAQADASGEGGTP